MKNTFYVSICILISLLVALFFVNVIKFENMLIQLIPIIVAFIFRDKFFSSQKK